MLGLFKRKKTEERALTLEQLERMFSHSTSTGIAVNADNAQSVSAVFSAMSFISKQVAGYPITSDNPGTSVLLSISPDTLQAITAYQWRISTMLNLLANGNSYSRIHWNRAGQAERIEFLASNRVTNIIEANKLKGYRVDGHPVPTHSVLHFRINSLDGLTGRSPITVCRESIGEAIKQNQVSGEQLKSSFKPNAVIEVEGAFNDKTALMRFKERMNAREKGGLLMLEKGMTMKTVSVSNADMEFIENRKFSVDEVARMFNLDKIWLQNSGTGAKYDEVNASQKSLLTNTIHPYLNTIESELKLKLIDASVKFNLSEIQRLDVNTRYEVYAKAIELGLLTPEEVKEREGLI